MPYIETVCHSPDMCEAASRDGSSTVGPASDEYVVLDLNISMAEEDAMDAADNLTAQMIKEEVRYAIQCRRLSQGKVELPLNNREGKDDTSGVTTELTPEEEESRKTRRERNNLAARRCRHRKREHDEMLEEEALRLESQNEQLRQTISKLEGERRKLVEIFSSHQRSCALANQQVAP